MLETIGQLLGLVAVALGFISYQMKTTKSLLIFQLSNALVFSAHYLLIGASTAVALNLLATISCVFYYFRDKRGSKSIVEPIVFAALIIITSLLTWDGWYSVFIMMGLVVGTVSLTLSNPQKTRYCMFLKSPLCLVYNIIVSSGGGIIYECAVLLSSIIGLINYRRQKQSHNLLKLNRKKEICRLLMPFYGMALCRHALLMCGASDLQTKICLLSSCR